MSFLYFLFIAAFLFLCFLLSVTVLIQEGKAGGLGSSFGGDTGDSLFGTSTPAVLKKFTGYLACFFMVLCILLSFWTGSLERGQGKASLPQTEQAQK